MSRWPRAVGSESLAPSFSVVPHPISGSLFRGAGQERADRRPQPQPGLTNGAERVVHKSYALWGLAFERLAESIVISAVKLWLKSLTPALMTD